MTYLSRNNDNAYIFPDISRYGVFRKCMNNAKMLQEYIEYHSRNFFSGFYEGRWKLMPDSKKANFNNWNDKNDKDLSYNEKKDELHKLGSMFEERGYTSGKVQFSAEFDQILQNQLIQNTRKHQI